MTDYETLKAKLIEYLLLGSCDGRIERQELRKELANLIDAPYNDSTHSLEKGKNYES